MALSVLGQAAAARALILAITAEEMSAVRSEDEARDADQRAGREAPDQAPESRGFWSSLAFWMRVRASQSGSRERRSSV